MEPAREVGGDFYDIFQIDAHRVGIAVADVSGKGIPAAFFMLIARTLLKAIALEGAGPGRTLVRLNDFLCGDNEETMFVTLFYGELDSRSGRLVYANGGHNHSATGDAAVAALPSTDGMALRSSSRWASPSGRCSAPAIPSSSTPTG
ncbi:MAG: SpoIIE family protein phosphatase [Geminicoccaceae bacterium]